MTTNKQHEKYFLGVAVRAHHPESSNTLVEYTPLSPYMTAQCWGTLADSADNTFSQDIDVLWEDILQHPCSRAVRVWAHSLPEISYNPVSVLNETRQPCRQFTTKRAARQSYRWPTGE